jgi:hypothetical protein
MTTTESLTERISNSISRTALRAALDAMGDIVVLGGLPTDEIAAIDFQLVARRTRNIFGGPYSCRVSAEVVPTDEVITDNDGNPVPFPDGVTIFRITVSAPEAAEVK